MMIPMIIMVKTVTLVILPKEEEEVVEIVDQVKTITNLLVKTLNLNLNLVNLGTMDQHPILVDPWTEL